MSTYAGDDTLFPEAFFLPDDGNGRAVGSVNPGFQALANRTAWLRSALLPAAALNFRPAASTVTTMQRAIFFGGRETLTGWMAINPSADNDIKWTYDGGATWSAFVAPAVGPVLDIASDGASKANLVVVPGTGTVAGAVGSFNGTTATWTNANVDPGYGFANGVVTYDPVNALWCVLYRRVSGSLVKCATSPDRITWTQRTLPAAFSGALPAAEPLSCVGVASGVATTLFANANASGLIDVCYSTDGGVTWGYSSFTGIASPAIARPAYGNGAFMILVYDPAGYRTQVWTSPTGATWTKQIEFPTRTRMTSLTCLGGKMWVASGLSPAGYRQLMYSFDGITWRSGVAFGTAQGVFASAGGLLVLDGTNAVTSFSLGPAPAIEVV